ncbi:hypothetical protein BJX63DRAFT_392997 [Aspergillus granulosus]|uniref:Lanthionine synthetase C family protein n=1 Tax=Aspergillus granulosus TaxID=176169 RepID=A0ABR4HF51_9EURO
MPPHRLQFYKNTLSPPEITQSALQGFLIELQGAVINGVKIIESKHPAGEDDGRGIFSGDLGIALAYLRLARQSPSLQTSHDGPLLSFYDLARARISSKPSTNDLAIGLLSPLPSKSPLSLTALRILYNLSIGSACDIIDSDLTVLHDAVRMALSHGATGVYHGHELGADEVLFGRAGLLWTIMNVQKWEADFDERQRGLLGGMLEDEMVRKLVEAIVQAGRDGGDECHRIVGDGKGKSKDNVKPLMWMWMKGHYGLGWAHGLTGILSILLSSPTEILAPHLASIGATINLLCQTCINENGHLPTCIPPRSTSSSHSSPLVQICHGSPAILALMGCALKIPELVLSHWTPEWDTAIRLATQRVWEEGLLSKGGGLCHGIAGNAWPLLMLYGAFEENGDILQDARENYATRMRSTARTQAGTGDPLVADYFLSRALAMLLHACETQPYNQMPVDAANDYRMPDHPYSLFEGLSGTVCAWSEACVALKARLRKMELQQNGQDLYLSGDSAVKECSRQQLGFPFLGGNGVTGLL